MRMPAFEPANPSAMSAHRSKPMPQPLTSRQLVAAVPQASAVLALNGAGKAIRVAKAKARRAAKAKT